MKLPCPIFKNAYKMLLNIVIFMNFRQHSPVGLQNRRKMAVHSPIICTTKFAFLECFVIYLHIENRIISFKAKGGLQDGI